MRLRLTLNAYWKSVRKARAALCALLIVLWIAVPCISSAQSQTPGLATEETLIKEFTDPLTTLPQISLKDAFTPANFGTHVQTNQVILRPIIPRLPRFSLFPLVQLIRPTFSLVTVPSARGGTRTEFGDMQLFDLAILPWPSDAGTLQDRVGADVRVSDRDLQERRARRMASGPGNGSCLHWHSMARDGFPFAEPDFLRLHVAQAPAPEHA